jgi:membrane fusion protein, multidrug efflux system
MEQFHEPGTGLSLLERSADLPSRSRSATRGRPSSRLNANVLALTETVEPSAETQAPASAPGPATEGKAGEARGPAPQNRLPDRAEPPAAEPDAKSQAEDQRKDIARRSVLRRPITVVMGAILLAAAMAGGYIYWDYARHFETTDDAFIEARQFAVAPKVSGYIVAVPVTDNQHVTAGDVIARIDDRDFRIALEQADAQVAAAKANLQNIDAQITVQQAQVGASQAQVEQAQAALTFAEQQAARYQDLAATEAGTVQMAEQTTSTLHQDQAALKNAQAALMVVQRQIDALKAQRSSAEAALAQANAQHDQAELNLSYTTVTAAQAGRVVNLTTAVGQFAQAGTNLTMFVPDEIWVTANYKETQLAHMRPGQPVTLRIDAYPDRVIRGHVASIQPGSGTAFSLLPAENATGNFVKVVQRVPVKIVMDNPPADVALGPGMSVVPSARVRPEPSLYERLAGPL